MWTTAAPASWARFASSAISTGVYGMWGHWERFARTPERAAVTTTLSSAATVPPALRAVSPDVNETLEENVLSARLRAEPDELQRLGDVGDALEASGPGSAVAAHDLRGHE